MCDPVTLGLILTAAGTTTQAVNNNVALRRQDRQAARGIRKQSELQREASNAVGDEIADLEASTGQNERLQSLEGFQQALRDADAQSTGALPDIVGASPRFAEKVEQGRAQVRTGAGERAGRLSRIDAPGYQRANEAASRLRTAADLNELQRRSGAEDFITQLRVAERRPDEFINALGMLMQGAGSAVTLTGGAGLPNFLRGGPNLGKLAKAGTLIDAPVNQFAQAARFV